MALLRAQVTLPFDTNIPRDVATNTFFYLTDETGSLVEEATDICTRLQTFYTAIQERFAGSITGDVRKRVYNMASAEPRPPLVDITNTITPATSAVKMPNEIAICLSYKQLPVAGVDRRRQRGRVYLGPLDVTAVQTSVTGDSGVSAAAITDITNAAPALKTGVGPTSGSILRHVVFSRVLAGPPQGDGSYSVGQIDAGSLPIDQYWVDDAFDVQRRRGTAPRSRTTVS